LKLHGSRQALADLARFRTFAEKEYNVSPDAQWFSFGGSYPGMLAGWFRLFYPHLVSASVASSAPFEAMLNFQGYKNVMASSISDTQVGGSQECLGAVQNAFAALGQTFKTADGRQKTATAFSVCGNPSQALEDERAQALLAEALTDLFPIQSNDPACTDDGCNIAKVCGDYLLNPSKGPDPLTRLLAMYKSLMLGDEQCLDFSWASYVDGYRNESAALPLSGDRSWLWQTCTEFGFYQTCDPGTQCPFTSDPHLSTVKFNTDLCEELFGITIDQVAFSINNTNERTGGWGLSGSRILIPNGSVDPWSAGGVGRGGQKSKDPKCLPTLWVEGASHHFWTHPVKPTDQKSVVIARAEIRKKVLDWISQPTECF